MRVNASRMCIVSMLATGVVVLLCLGFVVGLGANVGMLQRPLFSLGGPHIMRYLTWEGPLWSPPYPLRVDESEQVIFIDRERNMVAVVEGAYRSSPRSPGPSEIVFDGGRVVHEWPDSVLFVGLDGTVTVHSAEAGWAAELFHELRGGGPTVLPDAVEYLHQWLNEKRRE